MLKNIQRGGGFMNRAEFFVEIAGKVRKTSKVVIVVTTFGTIALRLINTELAAVIAVILAMPLVILAPITIFSGINKVSLLHRFMKKDDGDYLAPSSFSLRLIPQHFLVSLGLLAPVLIVAMLFLGVSDTSKTQASYSSLPDILIFFQLLVFWDYLAYSPLFKRLMEQRK